jgi:hypothetical protein
MSDSVISPFRYAGCFPEIQKKNRFRNVVYHRIGVTAFIAYAFPAIFDIGLQRGDNESRFCLVAGSIARSDSEATRWSYSAVDAERAVHGLRGNSSSEEHFKALKIR